MLEEVEQMKFLTINLMIAVMLRGISQRNKHLEQNKSFYRVFDYFTNENLVDTMDNLEIQLDIVRKRRKGVLITDDFVPSEEQESNSL